MLTINLFGYDVTNIVYFIAGAFISAIISYFFSIRRERKLLKLKLEIDTTEIIQNLITNSIDYSATLKFNNATTYDYMIYNDLIQENNTNCIFINSTVQRISDKNKDSIADYSNFSKSICSIMFILETRQIPLLKFQVFHSELGDALHIFSNKESEIFEKHREMGSFMNKNEYIPNKSIEEIQKLYNELVDITYDIDAYLLDLQIGLQNEFYRKIFRKGVPIRRPKDPECKVLIPQKNKASFLS